MDSEETSEGSVKEGKLLSFKRVEYSKNMAWDREKFNESINHIDFVKIQWGEYWWR